MSEREGEGSEKGFKSEGERKVSRIGKRPRGRECVRDRERGIKRNKLLKLFQKELFSPHYCYKLYSIE